MQNLSIFNSNTEQQVFGYKILSFGLGLVLISYALVILIRTLGFQDPYQNSIQQVSQMLASSNQWEVITLGNSHNKAIDIDTIKVNGYHLWSSGGDFFETHHKIIQVVPRLPNLHTVIITASYFPWYQDNHATRSSTRRIVHASIPGFYFGNNDLISLLYGKLHYFNPFEEIMRSDSWRLVFKQLLSQRILTSSFNMPDGQLISEDYFDCKYPNKSEMIDTIPLEGVRSHYKIQTNSIVKRPDIHIATYKILVETIEYLQERNIRIIFYTPPYFYRYTELYDPDTMAYAHRSMERLQAEYDIEYYDYSIDEEFIYDHTLFTDDDHLNLCGAKKFSAKFRTNLFSKEK